MPLEFCQQFLRAGCPCRKHFPLRPQDEHIISQSRQPVEPADFSERHKPGLHKRLQFLRRRPGKSFFRQRAVRHSINEDIHFAKLVH